jgi:hypothetical protein
MVGMERSHHPIPPAQGLALTCNHLGDDGRAVNSHGPLRQTLAFRQTAWHQPNEAAYSRGPASTSSTEAYLQMMDAAAAPRSE